MGERIEALRAGTIELAERGGDIRMDAREGVIDRKQVLGAKRELDAQVQAADKVGKALTQEVRGMPAGPEKRALTSELQGVAKSLGKQTGKGMEV